jgi:hypothetical protein
VACASLPSAYLSRRSFHIHKKQPWKNTHKRIRQTICVLTKTEKSGKHGMGRGVGKKKE